IAMAGVAGHDTRSPEIVLVDVLDHLNHAARGRLARSLLRVAAPIALYSRFDMAVCTVVVGGRGDEPHRVHEFIHRDSLEHGDVLEGLFRHQLPWRRSLTMRRCKAQQPETSRCYHRGCPWPGSERHRLFLVLPTHSLQGPSLPEGSLNRIDAIFFPHVAVCCPVRP